MLEGSSRRFFKFSLDSLDSCGVRSIEAVERAQVGFYYINLNVQVILRGSFRMKIDETRFFFYHLGLSRPN